MCGPSGHLHPSQFFVLGYIRTPMRLQRSVLLAPYPKHLLRAREPLDQPLALEPKSAGATTSEREALDFLPFAPVEGRNSSGGSCGGHCDHSRVPKSARLVGAFDDILKTSQSASDARLAPTAPLDAVDIIIWNACHIGGTDGPRNCVKVDGGLFMNRRILTYGTSSSCHITEALVTT
ncbi:hypothetical protein OH77DRAFT_721066 [Trametes cingulata]|nr:hypothetical protein OH77DRAFT_721066 [Trametes cingulata]